MKYLSSTLHIVFATVIACPCVSMADVSLTQTFAYDYEPQTGRLLKEIEEVSDSDLCLVKEYDYDVAGRISLTRSRNCNGSAGGFPGSGPMVNQEAAIPSSSSLSSFQAREVTSVYSQAGNGGYQVFQTGGASEQLTSTYSVGHNTPSKILGVNSGEVTQIVYDSLGRKILEKRADGNGRRWNYEFCSLNPFTPEVSCNVNGLIATHKIIETPLRGPLDVGAPTSTGTPNGRYVKTYYNSFDWPVRTETLGADGRAIYQDNEYDKWGRVVSQTRPYFSGETSYKTRYEYDFLGRLKKVIQPNTAQTSYTYSALNSSVSNALQQTTTQYRNEVGLISKVLDAKNGEIRITYDALGRILTSRDPDGNLIRLEHDIRGRKKAMTDPSMGSWAYNYNAAGDLVWQRDAKSQISMLYYDNAARLITKSEPSSIVRWYFGVDADGASCPNGIGKLCHVTGNNGYARKHFYDSLSRPSSTHVQLGTNLHTISRTYDQDGRLSHMYAPFFQWQNKYDSYGYLKEINDGEEGGNVYWRALSRNAEGKINEEVFGNNVSSVNAYQPTTGRLTATTAGPSNAIQNISYNYDLIGNLKNRNDALSGVNASYTYDSKLNRLETETLVGGGLATPQVISWEYTAGGDIKSRSDVGIYNYLRAHAVQKVTGTVNGLTNPTYEYDNNGNLISVKVGESAMRTIVWNSFNMVESISQSAGGATNQLSYLYSPEGNRVRETFTRNGLTQRISSYVDAGLGDGILYEEDYNPTTNKTFRKGYFKADGETIGVFEWNGISTPKIRYWHKDNLGSLVVVTDDAGAVAERLSYEPFGKRRNTNGFSDANGTLTSTLTDRGFTQHEMMDEVGLINMNGRIYDPAISRFLSPDPYIQDPLRSQSYNRYSYVLNNPLSMTDPTGFNFVLATDAAQPTYAFDTGGVCFGCSSAGFNFVGLGGDYSAYDRGLSLSMQNDGWSATISLPMMGSQMFNSGSFASMVSSGPSFDSVARPLGMYDKFSMGGHVLLSGLGTIPILGIVPDVVDLFWTAAEIPFGKSTKLDLSLAGLGVLGTALPGPGDGAAGIAKVGTRASHAAKELPSALRGGPANVHVYQGVADGKAVYAGITNNLTARQAAHGERFLIEPLTTTSLMRGETRAIEQALIVENPGFQNIRNSISPNHSYYRDAVEWGKQWLRSNGY